MTMDNARHEVGSAFEAAIKASMPDVVMAEKLPQLQEAPTAILAIGKASGPMAQACRDFGLQARGMLITHDPSVAVDGFDVFVGGHPVPNQGSLDAAIAALSFVQKLDEKDHLLVLLSGGGSALMTLPQEGFALADKMLINETLLKSGMDIHQMNAIRRLVSQVKGGRLARAAQPAKVTQWVMSDVPESGDITRDLAAIASGPFVEDPVPLSESISLLKQAGLDHHPSIVGYLKLLDTSEDTAPLRAGDEALTYVTTSIIASNLIAREAASSSLDGSISKLPDLTGEARDMGARLAELVMDGKKPMTAVTGGETVVTMGNRHGLGGRSQELALAFLVAMSGYQAKGHDVPDCLLLAGGTDGRDGPTDAAGAIVSTEMLAKGEELDLMRRALSEHNSYDYLDKLNALIKMPPTGTNLGDVVILKVW